jgi:hypothetical protein
LPLRLLSTLPLRLLPPLLLVSHKINFNIKSPSLIR